MLNPANPCSMIHALKYYCNMSLGRIVRMLAGEAVGYLVADLRTLNFVLQFDTIMI